MPQEATASMFDEEELAADDADTSVIGGAVRSMFRTVRNVGRTVKSVAVGRLPHLPTKTVARSAGKLSDVYDITDSIRTAHGNALDELKNDQAQAGHTQNQMREGFRPNRWAHAAKVVRTAVPTFVRSAILGTLVFDLYEHTVSEIGEVLSLSTAKPAEDAISTPLSTVSAICGSITGVGSSFTKTHPLLSDSMIAVAGGTAGGLAHALGYIIWSKSASVSKKWVSGQLFRDKFHGLAIFLQRYGLIGVGGRNGHFTPPPPVHALGTCLSHSLVHASLFGSYVATKLVLLGAVEETLLPLFSKLYDVRQDRRRDTAIPMSVAEQQARNISRSQALIKCEQYCGFMCIVLAGGVAGVVSEGVTTVTENLELESIGVRQAVNNLRYDRTLETVSISGVGRELGTEKSSLTPTARVPWSETLIRCRNMLPRIGSVFTVAALLPNVLGFLAYEYGKEIIENSQNPSLKALRGLY